ncbi:hypothetical protein TIFTF001_023776 [Ficus carica]|uniref:Nuclear transcription factor Y subunit n=1 Tax=Ficus carica TaxID=3494 RepID=A0AA88DGG1_FICCA|nr:hypothetical protein TIFTF001_023776 [Ficus carica]
MLNITIRMVRRPRQLDRQPGLSSFVFRRGITKRKEEAEAEEDNSENDNCEADEQQKQSESQLESSSPAAGISHGVNTTPNVQYATPPQFGAGHAVAPAAYPYPDPYYRSIFAPYDAQPYPPQPYGGQPMVHLQLMGIQQAGVPLPSDAVEEPVFVNAKQYHGILRRRQSRAKAESENKALKSRKAPRFFHLQFLLLKSKLLLQPYLHESRHLHALRRARGCGGRFLNSKKNEKLQDEVASGDKSQPNINLNSDKNERAPADGTVIKIIERAVKVSSKTIIVSFPAPWTSSWPSFFFPEGTMAGVRSLVRLLVFLSLLSGYLKSSFIRKAEDLKKIS